MSTKVLHIAIDLALVSTIFAGIRRSSGYKPATDKIENEKIRYVADKFFDAGEWIMDRSVEQMSKYPEYFKRK
ncbi:hypothetical protein BKA69DRAFT_1103456 [Paraphysoderma sedebokerense]|nr:hypothetical protein BKA69DRAFT_1103456 [Paraphysoderma sedebokerense]